MLHAWSTREQLLAGPIPLLPEAVNCFVPGVCLLKAIIFQVAIEGGVRAGANRAGLIIIVASIAWPVSPAGPLCSTKTVPHKLQTSAQLTSKPHCHSLLPMSQTGNTPLAQPAEVYSYT